MFQRVLLCATLTMAAAGRGVNLDERDLSAATTVKSFVNVPTSAVPSTPPPATAAPDPKAAGKFDKGWEEWLYSKPGADPRIIEARFIYQCGYQDVPDDPKTKQPQKFNGTTCEAVGNPLEDKASCVWKDAKPHYPVPDSWSIWACGRNDGDSGSGVSRADVLVSKGKIAGDKLAQNDIESWGVARKAMCGAMIERCGTKVQGATAFRLTDDQMVFKDKDDRLQLNTLGSFDKVGYDALVLGVWGTKGLTETYYGLEV